MDAYPTDAPDHDVLEVSIFGPGKGECIVVHVGEGRWIIVDSCRDQATKSVVALDYLRGMGVDPATDVDLVVASHAHDDHIAGIGQIVESCENASFVTSAALVSEEFLRGLALDRRIARHVRSTILAEYERAFNALKPRKSKRGWFPHMKAYPLRDLLVVECADGSRSLVKSLSPSDHANTRANESFARALALPGEEKRLSAMDPNELAVALWVSVGSHDVLLGADLTIGPEGCGWGAVLDAWTPPRKAAVFKVSHHGSPTGHHPDVWSELLNPEPYSLLAPFRGGVRPLPGPEDVARILSLSDSAYISASPKSVAKSSAVRAAQRDMAPLARNVRDPYGRVGQVRARADFYGDWDFVLVDPGRELSEF